MLFLLAMTGLLAPIAFVYILIARMQAKRSRRKWDPPTKLPFWWVPPFLFMEGGMGKIESMQPGDESEITDFKIGFGDGGFDESDYDEGAGGAGQAYPIYPNGGSGGFF